MLPAGRTRFTVAAAILLTTLLKLCLAFLTFGTNDAGVWDASAKIIREGNSRSIYQNLLNVNDADGRYLHQQIYNHPPFMIRLISGMNTVEDLTGIKPHVSIRVLDSVADAGTLAMTALIIDQLLGSIPLWSFLLVAFAPAWIFISGFHSNSDPLMVFFLVLTVYLAEVRRLRFLAVVSFTLATGIKIVPLLMLPAFLLYLDRRNRIRALATIGAFWAVTSAPWLLNTPKSFITNIFLYRSVPGQWGIGWLLRQIPAYRFIAERCSQSVGLVHSRRERGLTERCSL